MGAGDEKSSDPAPLGKLAIRKATAERLLSDFQAKVDSAPKEELRKVLPETYFAEDHPLHPNRIHSSRERINEILTALRKQHVEDDVSGMKLEPSEP